MALLNESVQGQLRQVFAGLGGPVKLLVFTQGEGSDSQGALSLECQMCHETRLLIEEVGVLDERITVEVYDFVKDEAIAQQYKVDKIPAVVVLGADNKDWGIRIYGMPSGYEFGSLIETMLLASKGQPGLLPKTMQALEKLDRPVHIQVYVTPTWPYCPRAVVLAHKLAMASEWITSDAVEANEFPHLANKYEVYGVPRTVINEVIHIEGAVPEEALIDELMVVMDEKKMERLSKQ